MITILTLHKQRQSNKLDIQKHMFQQNMIRLSVFNKKNKSDFDSLTIWINKILAVFFSRSAPCSIIYCEFRCKCLICQTRSSELSHIGHQLSRAHNLFLQCGIFRDLFIFENENNTVINELANPLYYNLVILRCQIDIYYVQCRVHLKIIVMGNPQLSKMVIISWCTARHWCHRNA